MKIITVKRDPVQINRLPTSKRKSPGRPRIHPHGRRKNTYYADYQEEAQIAQLVDAGSSRTGAVQKLVRSGVALESAEQETWDQESGFICKLIPIRLVDELVQVEEPAGDQLVDELVQVEEPKPPTWEEVEREYQRARENYQRTSGRKAKRTQTTEGPIRSCIAILARLRHLAEQRERAAKLEASKVARRERRREKAGKLPPWQAPQSPEAAKERQQAQPWGRNPGAHSASPWGPWKSFGPRMVGGSILDKLTPRNADDFTLTPRQVADRQNE